MTSEKTAQLIEIANSTLAAINEGEYTTSSGNKIDIHSDVQYSIDHSVLYTPDMTELKKSNGWTRKIFTNPVFEVTNESVLDCAQRLYNSLEFPNSEYCADHVCILNFASAKNPGGGFLRGANAQEESIARSSSLYSSLIQHIEFYEENKKSQRNNIGLYLDYAIYSPDVVVIRNDKGEWLDDPFTISVVTSPAPNRTAILTDEDTTTSDDMIRDVFNRRIYQVLSIMGHYGYRTIVLGAWGCGIFGNDPWMVAKLFKENLQKLPFFAKVAFPIYDRPDSETFRAFVQTFGSDNI